MCSIYCNCRRIYSSSSKWRSIVISLIIFRLRTSFITCAIFKCSITKCKSRWKSLIRVISIYINKGFAFFKSATTICLLNSIYINCARIIASGKIIFSWTSRSYFLKSSITLKRNWCTRYNICRIYSWEK